ncbi:MAG: helix-turn-helix domain-containing protein [Polyangiales bacterium]
MFTENTTIEVKGTSRRLWSICRAAERQEIARVLEEHRQNRTHAAVALGISRRTLLNKIKAYALTPAACREYKFEPITAAPAAVEATN